MEEHSFSVEAAKHVGVNQAILLKSIRYWCEKNEFNGRHLHDGRYWSYNSVTAWQRMYPYMSRGAIQRALSKLEEAGLILTGNFNDEPYDKTKWYALTDAGLAMASGHPYQNGTDPYQNGMGPYQNGTTPYQNGTTIPDTNQILTTDVDSNSGAQAKDAPDEREEAIDSIIDYLNSASSKRFQKRTSGTRSRIRTLLSAGYTPDDFRTVIDRKVRQWGRDPRMSMYIRPKTLFAQDNFESYLNETDVRRDGGHQSQAADSLSAYD